MVRQKPGSSDRHDAPEIQTESCEGQGEIWQWKRERLYAEGFAGAEVPWIINARL